MKKRGRRSIVDILTLPKSGSMDRVERPTVPSELTDEECEVWAAVVGSRPHNYFGPDSMPLLSQYARHVVQARRIAELIERASAAPNLRIRDYDRLLKIQGRESVQIASLATKMRIAQQSTRTHRGNQRDGVSGGLKPWEDY
jgi:hypothetical protein